MEIMCEEDLKRLKATPPSANEKLIATQKHAIVAFEGKLKRCKEVGEILRKFGTNGNRTCKQIHDPAMRSALRSLQEERRSAYCPGGVADTGG
jgi:hypothetical protein